MSWVSAGIAGGTALISLVSSVSQKAKAKKLEEQNKRPTELVPQGAMDALQLTKQLSTEGLPSASKIAAEKQIETAAATARASATDQRSGAEALGAIQAGTNAANENLVVQDANVRQAKQQAVVNEENVIGQWQDKVWDWNSKAKYEENATAINALKTASQENLNTALNQDGSGVASAKESGAFKGLDISKDPTIVNADGFTKGIPDSYTSYLQRLQQIRSMTGSFQPQF